MYKKFTKGELNIIVNALRMLEARQREVNSAILGVFEPQALEAIRHTEDVRRRVQMLAELHGPREYVIAPSA